MKVWIVGALLVFTLLLVFRRQLAHEKQMFHEDWGLWLKHIWKEWGEPFLIAAVIAIIIRTFIIGPYKIPTGSMRPTLLEGDRIFVDKLTYKFRQPRRGEIIVFKYPKDPKKDFVKRLIAFGGEEVLIRDNVAYINGRRLDSLADIPVYPYYNRNDWDYGKEGVVVKVPEHTFYVLGDNSAQSSDSRNWGFVSEDLLIGRVFLIWWPFNRTGFTR